MKAEHIEAITKHTRIKYVTITWPIPDIANFMIDEARARGLLQEEVEGELKCEWKYYDGLKNEVKVILEKQETEKAKEIE